jgi:hypothetical protein
VTKNVYTIRDWDDHFEVSQSRKCKRLHWVGIPIKHDGKSFRRLMLMEGGIEIYGAWILLVQVAAKCPVRGVLADADGPLDAEDLAIKTGCRPELFENAFKVLSDNRIGWLVVADWERTGSVLPLQTDRQDRPTNQPEVAEIAVASGSQAGGRAGGNGHVSGWGKVSDRLQALRASRWREAISEAKQCGCNPGLALTLIDYGISKGYGTGAIICRLSKAGPNLPVDCGWPETPKPATAAPAPDPQAEVDQLRYDIITNARKAKWPREKTNAVLAEKGLDLI